VGPSTPRSSADRRWRAASAFAAAGILVSGYLLLSAVRGYAPICLAGACERVAASPYARILGLPIAGWGLALYVTVCAVALAGAQRQRSRPLLLPALFSLVVFGAAFSAYLVWLQVGVLHAVCAWCATSALLWGALVVTAVLLLQDPI
jgi:uncharacterized membrane protein